MISVFQYTEFFKKSLCLLFWWRGRGNSLISTAHYKTPAPSQSMWGVRVGRVESCSLLVIAAQNHMKITSLEPTLNLLTCMHCGPK